MTGARPRHGEDIAGLILNGSDADIRAAAADPDRPTISTAEASAALAKITVTFGIAADDFERGMRSLVRWSDR